MDKLANREVDRVSRWCCWWSKIDKFIFLKLSSHLDHGCSQHITVYAAMHAAVKGCSSEQCLKTCRRQCSAQWLSMCQRARWGPWFEARFRSWSRHRELRLQGPGSFPTGAWCLQSTRRMRLPDAEESVARFPERCAHQVVDGEVDGGVEDLTNKTVCLSLSTFVIRWDTRDKLREAIT